MPRYLECVEWNEGTQQCDAQAWVVHESQAIPDWYPTVDQAQTVGSAMFLALVGIAAMSLLLPPREKEE